MRLGGKDIEVGFGTLAERLFGKQARLRFRHRYEVNPAYIPDLLKGGMVFSGKAPGGEIMQILELPDHLFFMATQSHPELTSRLEAPNPFFAAFLAASLTIPLLQR